MDREKFEVRVFHVRDGKGRVKRDQFTEFVERHADVAAPLPHNLEDARDALAAATLDVLVYTDIGMEPFSYALAFSRAAYAAGAARRLAATPREGTRILRGDGTRRRGDVDSLWRRVAAKPRRG